ncbi:MAG TPA: hypothetical protein VNA57_00190 [Acidimicrobiales bacterium]|nr:hypothetical protein [Acidimicrobiales bacterium]
MGGPVPPGSAAITLGRLVIVRCASAGNERLMRHELVHVRQWAELGVVGFLRAYLGSYFRSRWEGLGHREAYLRIPLEVQAEQEALGATAGDGRGWAMTAGAETDEEPPLESGPSAG